MALAPEHAADGAPPGGAYAPADLQSAYGLTTAAASAPVSSAVTVAVVDAYNDPGAASDLAAYRAHYDLPACLTTGSNPCLRVVNATGGAARPAPDPTGDWEFEESVDLDMVSAICPHCDILLIEAKSASISDLATAEGYATTHASVVSDSWGSGAEFTGENAFDPRFDRPGVAIVAAAGDSGYGAQYPAAAQFVTAVGGTTLTGATATSAGTQSAWSGTGAGCSALEAKPAWQAGVTPTGCRNRTETDVSAVADPGTPVAIYDSVASAGLASGWNAAGGTSVATPIIAATYALAGPPAAGTYPASYPYLHRSALRDVAAGSDGSCEATRQYLCRARAGYDGPTGLGTPVGTAAFAGPASAVTVTDPGTQDLARGARARLRLTAAATAGAKLTFTAAGLPAGLRMDSADGVISGRPSVSGTFTVTVTAAGSGAGRGTVTFSVVVLPRIVNHHPASGLVRLDAGAVCLAASGTAGAGATAEIRRCDGRRAQSWRYVAGSAPGGSGTLKLRGRCLTAAGTRARARAALRRCTGSAGQRWRYRASDQLYNPAAARCLADPGDSKRGGTAVRLAACGSGAAQSWQLPASAVLSAVAGRCLADPGHASAAGTRIEVSRCAASAAQRWTMKRAGTLRIAGKCLTVAGSSRLDGAAVRLARCGGGASQQWSAGPGGELLNGYSGRCLAGQDSSSAKGTKLVQEDCYGKAGEVWAVS